jgi:hypothetical protein
MENALKGADSDSLKRALMSFGSQCGLALYDREQRHVTRGDGRRQRPGQLVVHERVTKPPQMRGYGMRAMRSRSYNRERIGGRTSERSRDGKADPI